MRFLLTVTFAAATLWLFASPAPHPASAGKTVVAAPRAARGVTIDGKTATLQRGYSFRRTAREHVLDVVDAKGARQIGIACICNSVDQGKCAASISGSTATCSEAGCKGACGWSVL